MVVKMKKYLFLVFHRDYLNFLKQLRSCGVVHVTRKKSDDLEPSPEMADLKQYITRLHKAIRFLRPRAENPVKPSQSIHVETILSNLEAKQQAYEKARHDLALLQKEIALAEPWGEFDSQTAQKLAEQNIKIRFFKCSGKKFQSNWENEFHLAVINQTKNYIFFVVFERPDKTANFSCEEVFLPDAPLSQLQHRYNELQQKIPQIEQEFTQIANESLTILETAISKAMQEVDFNEVQQSAEAIAEDTLLILAGWVPADRQQELEQMLKEAQCVAVEVDPEPDEHPPIVLKNGYFARLFEPIARMFSLPDYTELDLTAAFAPFFTLFFGLCLGDAGYGVLILLGTFIARFYVKEELKPIMTLGMVLGFSTTVVGILTGTIFGVWLTMTESAQLQKLVILGNPEQIFYLALIIGVVQILFGIIIQMLNRIRQFGFPAGLSPLGWFILILSLVGIMLKGMHQNELISQITAKTIWVGIGLILLFNDMKANIFVRLGKGLWELYNITGFFGDVLSYVRLFALGISSAILGLVINSIASQMQGIPWIGPVLFILILLIGHTANILLSGLGAFVHPMRLTFVEFYKNAGFKGGGKPYKPFVLSESK